MHCFHVREFVLILKHRSLMHHHSAIDRILNEFVRTHDHKQFAHDLIRQVGSRDVVLESAYLASLSHHTIQYCSCLKRMSVS